MTAMPAMLPHVNALIWLACAAAAGQPVDERGAVVSHVAAGSAAELAGLRSGDRLTGWRALGSAAALEGGGELASPLDFAELELERAWRGPTAFVVLRDGARLDVELSGPRWGLEVRPPLPAAELERFQRGLALVEGGSTDDGCALWRGAARRAAGRPELEVWWLARIARAQAEAEDALAARATLEQAIERAEGLSDRRHAARLKAELADLIAAQGELDDAAELLREALAVRQAIAPQSLASGGVHLALGDLLVQRGDPVSAIEHHRAAADLFERELPDTLELARALNGLGRAQAGVGDLAHAEQTLSRALEIRERAEPRSLAVAGSLNNLARTAWARGDLTLAERRAERARALYEELAPDGPELAGLLNGLGILAFERGDLPASEAHYRRALAIQERAPAGDRLLGLTLNNLGNVRTERGDLAAAERTYRRALELQERHAPGGLESAVILNNLGLVASERGDLAAAQDYYARALAIHEQRAPGSLDFADTLANLGKVYTRRGELELARQHLEQALAIEERQAPESTDTAATLVALGDLALAARDPAAAERRFRSALALQQRLAPSSPAAAVTSILLGRAARARGDVEEAERRFRRALAIQEASGLESDDRAVPLYELALLRERGDPSAVDLLLRATSLLESQRSRLGGSDETRSEWAAQQADVYYALVDRLIEQGRPEQAFGALERFKAQNLVALLARRDLDFALDLSAELERERREANVRYDRLVREIALSSRAAGEGGRGDLTTALAEARRAREEVAAKIRTASPRLAALKHPAPLDLAGAQELLAPGELLLAYSLGPERSHLFAVGPDPGEFLAVDLGATAEALRRRVERFRDSLRPPHAAERVRFLSAGLSRTLLAPVADRLARAEWLLIAPDRSLHYLPFAALLREGAPQDGYLVESLAISVVASATLLGELRGRGGAQPGGPLVAFGDPRYPGAASGETRLAPQGGLPALRHARREVEAVAAAYPGPTRLLLGDAAREEAVKALPRDTAVLHFASHGLIDDQSPLDSALALTIPERWSEGEENGLLQAWEIFEQVRTEADLVTLSACDTALGRELAGEGMLGLTRAFHYAGARSIVASLWAVNDSSTADLMAGFYRYLAAGERKDDALRRAQLDLLHGRRPGEPSAVPDPETAHPFHWAGFVLLGPAR